MAWVDREQGLSRGATRRAAALWDSHAFPQARMKLLIIDPNVSLSSPSMKGVVRSLPALRRAGFEIELWCWHCDDDITADRVVRLPRLGAVRVLYTHAFGCWARLRSWWTILRQEGAAAGCDLHRRLVSAGL